MARAASALTALSKASGPSMMAPVICPRSAILHKAAASMVEGILGVTVSTAERMATLGCATPHPCSSSLQLPLIITSRRTWMSPGLAPDIGGWLAYDMELDPGDWVMVVSPWPALAANFVQRGHVALNVVWGDPLMLHSDTHVERRQRDQLEELERTVKDFSGLPLPDYAPGRV